MCSSGGGQSVEQIVSWRQIIVIDFGTSKQQLCTHLWQANNAVECIIGVGGWEGGWSMSKKVDEQKHMVRRPKMTRENVSDVSTLWSTPHPHLKLD